MARLPTLRTIIRGLLQVWAWLLLVFLFAADYKTAEYLKHGPDIIHFDNEGRILRRPPLSVRDWAGPVVLVVVQGLVMWALYRSHRPKPNGCGTTPPAALGRNSRIRSWAVRFCSGAKKLRNS